jgi:hypothetical protein
MNGNADYALANEWLRNEVSALSKTFPDTYFLIWNGQSGEEQEWAIILGF